MCVWGGGKVFVIEVGAFDPYAQFMCFHVALTEARKPVVVYRIALN